MTIGIYKIINNIDKKYYIGSSTNIERRWFAHRNSLNKKTHVNILLQRAWDKYGSDNFSFIIVESCDGYSKDRLFQVEQSYLDRIENCYNISKFAGGGDLISYHPNRDEIVEKISNAVKLRYENISEEDKINLSINMVGEKNHMFGKCHSTETKRLISEKNKIYYKNNPSYRKGNLFIELFGEELSNKIKKILFKSASSRVGDKNSFFGKTHTDETKAKISESKKGKYFGSQNTPVTIDNVDYNSLGEASKILGISVATIRWRVLSKNKKFEAYKYKEED